jgi:hypothetical protein
VILFAGLIIDATVGPAYADVAGLAGQFALLGVLAALLQLLLYSGLARRGRQAEILVWAGIAVEVLVVSAWFHGSAQQILAASILVCTVVSLAVAASEIRASTRSTIDVG